MSMSYDSPEVKQKAKAQTIFIELIDQRDSGYVLNGTEGTKHEVRIKTPRVEFIPTRGFRVVKTKNPDTGVEEWQNEEIRWVKNHQVLSVAEQNRRGIKPARNRKDGLIPMVNGNFSVTREGAFMSLFDYLTDVFYNESNPKRPDTAKAIYRVVELGKKEESLNENKVAQAQAVSFLGTLYERQGKKGYVYNEPKINALCNLFLVYAETPSGKINGLIAHAEKDPEGFLDKAMRFEQTINMEIGFALELNLVHFEKNALVYSNKAKVIADAGRGNLKHEKKIEKVAELLGSEDYKEIYNEFKIELAAAQEKQFK